MLADIRVLHESPSVKILDFQCKCDRSDDSRLETSKTFSINFTRKGYFSYRAGKRAWVVHSGGVLLEGAGCERVVTHPSSIKDECTVIEITDSFLEDVSNNSDEPSHDNLSTLTSTIPISVLPTTPKLEYLHSSILHASRSGFSGATLKVDVLLVNLLREVCVLCLGKRTPYNLSPLIDGKLLERHLEAIDRAKSFVASNFQDELSLAAIARHARMSEFHFSRLFKDFTSRSPYQYVIDMRLEHAALLLRDTYLPVTEICFDSGFNSFEHFVTTFTARYRRSPTKYRRSQ